MYDIPVQSRDRINTDRVNQSLLGGSQAAVINHTTPKQLHCAILIVQKQSYIQIC